MHSEMLPEKDMLKCRGCAAKLSYIPLNSTLKKLDSKEIVDVLKKKTSYKVEIQSEKKVESI